MKKIKYEKEFKAADGQPFTIFDPDVMAQRKARDEALARKDTQWQAPTIDCDFGQVIIWFMNHIPFSDEKDKDGSPAPPRKLTPEDAGNAYAVIKAFRDTKNGYVELEDSVYTWLLDMVKLDGIEAFRPVATQAIVKERLEDLIKEVPKS
jgi:hypothetical protein